MSNFLDLKGKTYLVTGASGGIGPAVSKLISEYGANVILTGRNEATLTELHRALNSNSSIIVADLDEDSDIEKLVANIGQIDGIVHCAGIVKPMPIKFINRKNLEKVLNSNFYSAVLLTSSLLKKKKLNPESSMVYISSISSKFPYLGGGLYVSSKAALEAFAKTLALEHSNLLRANIISPGLVKTKIFEDTEQATGEEEMKAYEEKYLLGFGETEDIANTCAFLLSSRSKWITGENIIMDGGLTIGSKK